MHGALNRSQTPSPRPLGGIHGEWPRAQRVNVIEWAQRGAALGAGALLVTSVDMEGHRKRLYCELVRAVSDAVTIPVIASGGMGRVEHLVDIVQQRHADAVAMADICTMAAQQLPLISRQQAPVVYDMTTVCYAASTKFTMTHKSIFKGRVKAVHVRPARGLDNCSLQGFRLQNIIQPRTHLQSIRENMITHEK